MAGHQPFLVCYLALDPGHLRYTTIHHQKKLDIKRDPGPEDSEVLGILKITEAVLSQSPSFPVPPSPSAWVRKHKQNVLISVKFLVYDFQSPTPISTWVGEVELESETLIKKSHGSSIYRTPLKTNHLKARELAQWAKALAGKPGSQGPLQPPQAFSLLSWVPGSVLASLTHFSAPPEEIRYGKRFHLRSV